MSVLKAIKKNIYVPLSYFLSCLWGLITEGGYYQGGLLSILLTRCAIQEHLALDPPVCATRLIGSTLSSHPCKAARAPTKGRAGLGPYRLLARYIEKVPIYRISKLTNILIRFFLKLV